MKWKWLLRSNSESFLTKRKDWEGEDMKGCYSEIVSRRYTFRGTSCESNALLWLGFYGLFRNMGQRPERML